MARALDGFFMALGFLASLAHGSSWPLLFLVFGDMTNTFVSYNATANFTLNGTSPADEFEDTMSDYSLRYVYIGIGVYVVTYIHIAFLQLSGERQTYRLRKMFFKALLRQNIGWYDSQQSGELTTRLAE
ncbi:multidrug resistance protein 1 [Elysia marginata]|uniref:Multidrug resistance protein 1 n=1 Tax=Elysia marginata TaxID=1093978 RepID=A0AAV4JW07_9GAST|nr:multidrug resistance protein 1 [Elysia marginata]